MLLVSDEVICGFGRTGEMRLRRAWGIKPDMMTLAKGINSGYVPLGATAVSEKIESAFHIDGPFSSVMHGYTYSGHALACAAGVATMEVLEKDNLLDNVKARGEQPTRASRRSPIATT